MKKVLSVFLLLATSLFFAGCAPVLEFVGQFPDKISSLSSPKAYEPTDAVLSACLEKAQKFEKEDDLQMALFYMKVAGALNPDNQKIIDKTKALESAINHQAKQHFKRGVTFYNRKKFTAARRHFLAALRYDPKHEAALDYLKNRLVPKEHSLYIAKKGDTLKSVAKKFYKDPGKDFIVAYFNNLKTSATLSPGLTLKIPILMSEFTQPVFDIQEELRTARLYLEDKRYEEVLVVADKVLEYNHLNKTAVELKNSAYFSMGVQFSRQERHPEALAMFRKIDPQDESVRQTIMEITNRELNTARNLLKEKQYDKALSHAEKILIYDTSTESVQEFINTVYCQQGMELLLEKKYAESLKVLNKADPGYDCIEKGISEVKASMTRESEVHYLKGVKFFLNEELNNAIREWEKTLALNPEHKEAKINIKNAKRLLEKLKSIK